jgi:hypothetical protein
MPDGCGGSPSSASDRGVTTVAKYGQEEAEKRDARGSIETGCCSRLPTVCGTKSEFTDFVSQAA